MYSSRTYQENYFTNRKKILEDFWKDEENETLKYIDDIEQLVSSTKTVLKGLVCGELDYDALKEQLTAMEHDLSNECESLEQDITTLTSVAKSTERITNDLNKQEEKGTKSYLAKIEELKKDLETKEFKIQNMERLYVELENIIKENIRTGSDQLLTLEQFSQFAAQNDQLRDEIEALEEEKKQCLEDYNNLLRENLNLRSKDESFELEKIKDALEEISTMGSLQKEAEQRINKLQDRFKDLNKECGALTSQVKDITKSLESLNIDNVKLNREIALINKELHPNKRRLNRSFTETTKEDSEFNSQAEEEIKRIKHVKHKSNFVQL
jgi:chromosome segregation ATPase